MSIRSISQLIEIKSNDYDKIKIIAIREKISPLLIKKINQFNNLRYLYYNMEHPVISDDIQNNKELVVISSNTNIINIYQSFGNLINLHIFSISMHPYFEHTLHTGFICKNNMVIVNIRRFMKYIPEHITHLRILDFYDCPDTILNNLPPNLEFLFITKLNKPLLKLPQSLKMLKIHLLWNKNIILPPNCKILQLINTQFEKIDL
jgi:hypothetical protein